MANKIKSGAIYFMITSDFIRFSVHLSLPAYMPRLCPGYSSQVTYLFQETQDHPRLIPATCYFHLQKNSANEMWNPSQIFCIKSNRGIECLLNIL